MLEDIEIFCLVAKHKSFSKAALELHISPSITTRRLARLERKLDVRLMNRTTRLVTLTEAGQLYYDEVRALLESLELSNRNIKSIKKDINGVIKIGLPVSISHFYVTPQLHKFLNRFPGLKVHIVHGNHLLGLLSNGFDLVMHCGELPDSSFHYKKLGIWQKIICASPEYLEKNGTPIHPDDLKHHNCLDHVDNYDFTWLFQEKAKVKKILITGNACINSSIDLCNLAVSGLGIVYLPSFTVKHKLQTGELVSILDCYRPPSLPLYLVYPTDQYMSQKVRVFIEFMRKLFKSNLD
ncbi:MAG: LysR family transcriptional regulator [Tatlockia sp.]|nr:LysR family transcriptional regulator [Tatlockia sp.]